MALDLVISKNCILPWCSAFRLCAWDGISTASAASFYLETVSDSIDDFSSFLSLCCVFGIVKNAACLSCVYSFFFSPFLFAVRCNSDTPILGATPGNGIWIFSSNRFNRGNPFVLGTTCTSPHRLASVVNSPWSQLNNKLIARIARLSIKIRYRSKEWCVFFFFGLRTLFRAMLNNYYIPKKKPIRRIFLDSLPRCASRNPPALLHTWGKTSVLCWWYRSVLCCVIIGSVSRKVDVIRWAID